MPHLATEILGKIFVLLPEGAVTYVERENGTVSKYPKRFATEILGRIFVLPTEAIDTYCEHVGKRKL